MSAPSIDDDLPQSVKDERDAALREGQQEEITAPEEEEVQEVRLSRRQAKQQEREQALEAERARAAKAEETIEALRRDRESDRQRMEEIQRNLAEIGAGARAFQQAGQQPAPQAQQAPDPASVAEKAARQMRKAEEALAKGDMAEYHSRLTKATLMQAEQRIMSRLPPPQQQQYAPPPQQFQKPVWATVVENKFPDVMLDPRGLNTVAAFAGLDPAQIGPEKLERAFTRAREELGLAKRKDGQRDQQRQMLSGGPSRGSAGHGGGKGPVVQVKGLAAKNYKAIAKAAGMSEADYVRAYAAMNPDAVQKE